jgi:hypothetical protein
MLKVFSRIVPHGKRAAGPRRIINFNLWRKGDSSSALLERDLRNGRNVSPEREIASRPSSCQS